MDRQIRRMGFVLLVLFGVLFLQLNNIQVLQAAKLSNASGNSRHITADFSRPRGVIQTADGVVVARSVPSNDAYKLVRQYPEGPLFAGITGFFSLTYGSDGVEATYDKDLSGQTLPIRHLSDLLRPRTTTEDLTLTISNRLQQQAATSLGHLKGAVVVIDPRDGSVLAMHSFPSYDPNALASHDQALVTKTRAAYLADPSQPMLARAYRRAYPPGSTFKVVDSAGVFDHDPALASKSYPILTQLVLPQTNRTLHNFAGESCGGMLPALLKVSCDTGFAQVGLDLGAQNLAGEANAFGYDHTPPLDLRAVAASNFPAPSTFHHNLPALAYSALGQQDVTTTALENALTVAGIADGGKVMAPHVMAQIRDSQGQLVRAWQARTWMQATSTQTAGMVRDLMVGVTQGGTATNVALPGVQVAAKTGTAEGAGTSNTSWLVAFAPAGAPTVAVAVVIEPQAGLPSNPTGSEVAGPIARAMLAAALAKPGAPAPAVGAPAPSPATGNGGTAGRGTGGSTGTPSTGTPSTRPPSSFGTPGGATPPRGPTPPSTGTTPGTPSTPGAGTTPGAGNPGNRR